MVVAIAIAIAIGEGLAMRRVSFPDLERLLARAGVRLGEPMVVQGIHTPSVREDVCLAMLQLTYEPLLPGRDRSAMERFRDTGDDTGDD